jgi:hypothetical protein
MTSDDVRFDLETYARLRAELACDGVNRQAVLARYGLDEDGWDAIDDRFQADLSRALAAPHGDEVPAIVLRYAEAFAMTQRDAPAAVLSLERFAACTRALERARDPHLALSKLGATLTDYLKSNQHWSPKLATDPELANAFRAALASARPRVLNPEEGGRVSPVGVALDPEKGT